jgi:hypothetical protein
MALGAIALGSEALRRSSNPADEVSRADLSDLKIALLETESALSKRLAEQEKVIRILKNVIADARSREQAPPASGAPYVPSQYREQNAA